MKKAQETGHTLGLAMIMKDEVEDLDRIIHDYGQYFDKIYVTVTDKKTHAKLLKKFPKSSSSSKLQLSYFKWIDHFGKARRYNQKQIKTDYWMWLDTDDEIEGADNLRQVIDHMDANDLDMVWFQYDYIRRVNYMELASIQWRERIIKTASKLEWRDEAVHETVEFQGDIMDKLLSNVMIKHRKTAEQMPISVERNRLILEKDWQRTHRPVTASYLGVYLKGEGDYEGAIEKLSFAARNGEAAALRFGAWQNLCECYFRTGNYTEALAATNESVAIAPDHPKPWYEKFIVYKAMGNYDLALQSAENAMSKRVEGELRILLDDDPSWYQYKAPFNVARAYLTLGNVERAYQLYSEVKKIAPEYIEELSAAMGTQWGAVFEQAYNDYLKKRSARGDIPTTPKIWPKNSIVYFCVGVAEEWGPESLATGIGGSEEAVIHLTKHWAKMGYEVTVYNNCIKEGVVDGVKWVRYERFNPRDTFDVLIVWRYKVYSEDWTARKKVIDMHDVPVLMEHYYTNYLTEGTKIAVRSQYHKSLFSGIPNDGFIIIPNGAELKTLENHGETRIKNKLVWTSSYDRGLEHLLRMWPDIRNAVPDATLDVYYGFEVFDIAPQGRSAEGKAWKRQMKALLGQEGVTEYGRVGSKRVAEAYKVADVWAYPTEYPEIDCITATKAMAAGAVPITTNAAVLPERNQGVIVNGDMTEKCARESFATELIALLNDESRKVKIRRRIDVSKYDWDGIAKRWVEEIFES